MVNFKYIIGVFVEYDLLKGEFFIIILCLILIKFVIKEIFWIY